MINQELGLTGLDNHKEETDLLRRYLNVPELEIRENQGIFDFELLLILNLFLDGSVNGYWVDDLQKFNLTQSKRL